jgi:hypothetical protein
VRSTDVSKMFGLDPSRVPASLLRTVSSHGLRVKLTVEVVSLWSNPFVLHLFEKMVGWWLLNRGWEGGSVATLCVPDLTGLGV